jgi:hypothetical protein
LIVKDLGEEDDSRLIKRDRMMKMAFGAWPPSQIRKSRSTPPRI